LNYDITHRLMVSGVWEMPRLKDSSAPIRWVLGGSQSNAIFTAATGVPLTILSGVNNAYDGQSCDFANYLGGAQEPSQAGPDCGVVQYQRIRH
jgi:hypothetical protein